jgi:proteasome accessory factor B
MGSVGEDSDIVGIAPRIQAYEPSFRDLNNAVSDYQVVQFDYRNPQTGEIMTRTLQPWLLRQVAGQWLVMGFDELRQDTRNFMLRRIVSKITVVKAGKDSVSFDPPAKNLIDAAVADLDALAQKQTALLRVKPDTEAWFRFELDLTSGKSTGEVELHYHDIYVLAEQLREYANEIEVLRPENLATLIRAGFEKVADQHA